MVGTTSAATAAEAHEWVVGTACGAAAMKVALGTGMNRPQAAATLAAVAEGLDGKSWQAAARAGAGAGAAVMMAAVGPDVAAEAAAAAAVNIWAGTKVLRSQQRMPARCRLTS